MQISPVPEDIYPAIFIEGGMHAREWLSPSSVNYVIEEVITIFRSFSKKDNYARDIYERTCRSTGRENLIESKLFCVEMFERCCRSYVHVAVFMRLNMFCMINSIPNKYQVFKDATYRREIHNSYDFLLLAAIDYLLLQSMSKKFGELYERIWHLIVKTEFAACSLTNTLVFTLTTNSAVFLRKCALSHFGFTRKHVERNKRSSVSVW